MVIGDWESPTDFSPLFNDELPAREIDSLLFSGLTRRDAQLHPIADLASEVPTLDNGGVSWDRAAAKMTVSYQLRAGLQWSDGQPLTAQDVAFTLKVIRDSPPGSALNSEGYSTIQDLKVAGPLRFTISFNRIYPQYLDLFPAILPQHRLDTGSTGSLAQNSYWAHPDVVSGPYRISELV
ncbi:MAG TPA: ABC transporter substrate-binding protein, partial [Candidatus Dormibacteraeota bacterium]|nr:ABC transporter substrate-binding protein [Candidatus Dormibacteraeota bacterium]